jgi:chromosome partitioning protein
MAMRTIALINQKGGCGKTTCSINLAACLAQIGQRTLLVDMDPQGHCAVGLAVPDPQITASIYDVLRQPGGAMTIKDVTWQIAGNFDLAPSSISLVALENELHDVPGRQDRLADALNRVSKDYDYCIIDCPPNVGLLTFNAMRACQEVVIPVETGYFSLHGLAKQLELLDNLRKQCNQDIRVRILATLYDIRTKLAREVLAELRERFSELLMEATINFNTKLKEAASFGQPITEYDPASKGFKDFLKLAQELMGPAPRISLDLSAYLSGGKEEPQAAVQDVLATIGIRQQADSLGRKADELKQSTHRELGLSLAKITATTQDKLDEFYGVRQLPEGVLFVVHCPNANSVSLAGDFNGWSANQNRMQSNGDPFTFKALVPMNPGRYRYRLVVDGQWKTDPHNTVCEPNEYGEFNSIVEVV